MLTVLSLCDYTGNWSKPYLDAGYDVRRVDLKHGDDVRLFKVLPHPVRGILAAPPCTHLAGSGARWWKEKGEAALLESLALVDACLRVVMVHDPIWWCLENPVGRLVHYLGKPAMTFHPSDYGDPWTKKTLLWGKFRKPVRRPVAPSEGSKMHLMAPSPERAALRSETPHGFCNAFFEANP